jgi:uncharacterized protein YndB with AHSA1/START domain
MRGFSFVLIGGLMTFGCGSHQNEEHLAATVTPETRSIEMTVMAEMPPDGVFELWTTVAGANRFFAPAADIGSKVGDPYVIIFDPEGDPEGANHGTQGAKIRSLDPGKHLAFGWTFPPFGPEFNTEPFPTWVEIMVEPFAGNPSHSTVHFAHHGFPTDPAWDEVFTTFSDSNWPLVLNRFLVFCRDGISPAWGDSQGDAIDNVLLKERSINAPVGEVWRAWTTKEGLEAFLCEQATVELRPGGSYEVLFAVEAPEGQRGSEGCQVVDIIPEKRLTFTWNSPPSLPEVRNQRTNVIVELTASEDGLQTSVRLLSIGWGTGEQWQASYRYFEAAWSTVFDWLEASFENGRTPKR